MVRTTFAKPLALATSRGVWQSSFINKALAAIEVSPSCTLYCKKTPINYNFHAKGSKEWAPKHHKISVHNFRIKITNKMSFYNLYSNLVLLIMKRPTLCWCCWSYIDTQTSGTGKKLNIEYLHVKEVAWQYLLILVLQHDVKAFLHYDLKTLLDRQRKLAECKYL